MRQASFDIVEPVISEEFKPKSIPPMPIIGIHTKDQSDTINLIKTFYLKFPQYRWFSFRDLRGLSEKEFANSLRDCFLSVWIDEKSAFGTFPLESMKSGVPVIGLTPNLKPDWLTEDNGIWMNNFNLLPDVIADFIQKLPEGYDTLVGDRGVRISGGEKQRIAIARAMIRRPDLLILDEATSSLDNINERIVQKVIDKVAKNCTALIIAHRLSTIRNADMIYVLDQGEVVESGTHEELLKQKGKYSAAYGSQE